MSAATLIETRLEEIKTSWRQLVAKRNELGGQVDALTERIEKLNAERETLLGELSKLKAP